MFDIKDADHCPWCGEELYLGHDDIEFLPGEIQTQICCPECGNQWTNRYTYKGLWTEDGRWKRYKKYHD